MHERCYGAFEGLLYADIQRHYPEAHAAWQARDIDARFPAGVNAAETMREFSQRVIGTITRLVNENKYRKVALVAHGGVLECAYRAARGMDFARKRDFDIFNASINRFHWDGHALQLLHWGDVRHLEMLEAALDEVDRA